MKCDLLLYDVTSTYFEGEMQACPIAKRGYSRGSRPDWPQVCLGLVVTEDGYPLLVPSLALHCREGNASTYGSVGARGEQSPRATRPTAYLAKESL